MAQAPAAARQLADVATPITGAAEDYDALVDRIGDARFVLLGEASHGTHEFYRERAELTKRLILERGVTAVAVEADWPDAYRVNAYVRGRSSAANAEEALRGFQRFPTWMWRNTVVVDFIEWLRDHNERLSSSGTPVGFYGLDLYNLYGSIEAVLQYLERVDPEAAARARYRYACFGDTGEDSRAYGYSAARSRARTRRCSSCSSCASRRARWRRLTGGSGRTTSSTRSRARAW